MKNKKLYYLFSVIILCPVFFIINSSQADAATLSLSPSSGSYSAGQTFSVDILLDTQGSAIDGVDIVYLNYNPAYLEVIDDNVSQSGVQITAGTLMPMTAANSVNTSQGKITFSQITAGGTTFTSSGAQVLATVHFRILQAVNTQVYFDFVANGTADTNVASVGRDILTTVTNGSYGPTVQPPPPVPPTPVPAPPSTPTLAFTKILYLGMSDPEVKKLQEFLATDKTIYPEGLITGYYGALTQQAVQRFQCKYQIVCQGTPETTGYGMVNQATLNKLNELYGVGIIGPTIEQLEAQIRALQEQIIKILQQLIQIIQQRINEKLGR